MVGLAESASMTSGFVFWACRSAFHPFFWLISAIMGFQA